MLDRDISRSSAENLEPRCLLTTIDLAGLVAGDGSIIHGADPGDYSGISVSSAGDVNGDGFDDIIIGAQYADGPGNAKSTAGESYLIFGGDSLPPMIDLDNLGSAGVTILGARSGDLIGRSVSSAGDVNGDGFDDIIIGADGGDGADDAKSSAGESYVILGGDSLPATIDLNNLGAADITIFGTDALDRSGRRVSGAGDVNGDGFDDLLIGASRADGSGNAKSSAGEGYVIFGGDSLPTTIELDNLGDAGITIFGADADDGNGISVSSAGDVNGDGFDDIIIGASYAAASSNGKPSAGESYVIFGGNSLPPTIDLDNLGSAGITIFGADPEDESGFSVSSAGDVNGDGFDDIIIGAFLADGAGNAKSFAGESYVVFGRDSLSPTIDLGNLRSYGITIFGADADDRSGQSVSSAGDLNGDGFDDITIGAYRANRADGSGNPKQDAGESYVIFGGDSLAPTIDLENLGSAAGITILGADANDVSGRSVSSAGDVNGDGFDDLIIGANSANGSDNTKSNAGESYVIFGGDFTSAVTHAGTAAAETLTGTAAANVMIGGRGNDTLTGNGGRDVLRGGEGDDVLAVANLNFNRIVGGNGTDTLRLDGSGQTLDLTAISDNRLLGIEEIDLTGTGANTLILNLQEVLNISDESNTLTVIGDDDTKLVRDDSWSQLADESIGGTDFHVYTQNTARLKVATTVFQQVTTIDLAALVAGDGTIIHGANASNGSGRSVSSAGDVNGDGLDDLIIGVFLADGAGNAKSNAGGSYVIFGNDSLPTTIDLDDLGDAGITIFGADALDSSGRSVSSAGDVNGDGFDDLILGARFADASGNAKSNAGESYVIFGNDSLPTTIDLDNLGSAGITIFGADARDSSGRSVSSAGDVNGDGFDDLIIGAYTADGSGNAKSFAGESYVIFGGESLPATIDLDNLGDAGITIFGADRRDYSGISVSSAGDVNGNGFDDLIIGAYYAEASGNAKLFAGDSYVIFGGESLPSSINLASLGSAGITIFGADARDASGYSVSDAGDVNGDGFDDLIIGAYGADGSGNAKSNAGESYVIFGGDSLPTTIDLDNLGDAGITIFGAEAGDSSGRSVSSAGDANGDGFDDLIIGAIHANGADNAESYAGESYVIFGGDSLPTTIDLDNLGDAGITIFGADASDYSGRSVSSAGDVNGDGFDDLIIGANRVDASGSAELNAGDSYVIFGGDFTSAVTHAGTGAAETLTGDTSANAMIGGRDDDVLLGNGGTDVLHGGEGNDLLAVADISFNRIVGGSGTDTLRLDGSGQTLDLTAIADNRIVDVEELDITGSGDNTLILNLREVVNISSHSNTVTVWRDGDDFVEIGTGWTKASGAMINGQLFEVFTQGAATLNVQNVDATDVPGNVDGDSDFDANDSFLIHLVKLSGTDNQIDQSKGSSPLSPSEIRERIDASNAAGDVDGDGDVDANDSFLIHLVQLAGTNTQIDQSKGNSNLTAAQIRSNVNSLGDTVGLSGITGGVTRKLEVSSDVALRYIAPPSLFEQLDSPNPGRLLSPGAARIEDVDQIQVWTTYRKWIDVI